MSANQYPRTRAALLLRFRHHALPGYSTVPNIDAAHDLDRLTDMEIRDIEAGHGAEEHGIGAAFMPIAMRKAAAEILGEPHDGHSWTYRELKERLPV